MNTIIQHALILFFLSLLVNSSLNLLWTLKRKVKFFAEHDRPLDGNIFFNKNPLLGTSTTYLGLIIATLYTLAISCFMSIAWGIGLGLGTYTGHLLGSFIKRRLNKKNGEFLIFIDYGDSILVSGLILFYFNSISILTVFLAVILNYILYPTLTRVAHKMDLKKHPY